MGKESASISLVGPEVVRRLGDAVSRGNIIVFARQNVGIGIFVGKGYFNLYGQTECWQTQRLS